MVPVIVIGHVYRSKHRLCINEFNIFTLYIAIRIKIYFKVYILPPLKFIFSQAVLNIVIYHMSIVTNLLVTSAPL